MNRTQLLRAVAVLVAVLILWGVAEIIRGSGSSSVEEVQLAPAIEAGTVDTVTFTGPSDTILLARGDDGWTVNGYRASDEGVGAFLNAFRTPLSGELVARNATSHARLGVDSAAGRFVRLQQGPKQLADLIVGHEGQANQTVYVRRTNDDRVYRVSGEVAPMFRRKVNDWRDKRIAAVDQDSVARIDIERGRTHISLARRDSSWVVDGGGKADSATMSRVLGDLHALEAQGNGFATPGQADSADFTRPERRLTAFATDGHPLTTLAFDSTSTGFLVKRADRDAIYWLYQWKVDELTPTAEKLRGQ